MASGPDPGEVVPHAPQCTPSKNQGLWPLGRPSPPSLKKPLGLHGTHATVRSGNHTVESGTAHAGGASPHFAHLYVIQSNKEWCLPPCEQASWELAAPKPKLDSSYALFEAAIWHQDRRVALYQFDDEWAEKAHMAYTELCHGYGWACKGYYDHREGRKLFEVGPWPKDLDKDKNGFSKFLLDAFKGVFAKIHEKAPGAKHVGLTYHGHGATADGSLFQGRLNAADSVALLTDATKKEPLSVLNFGGNCAEGRWNMLQVVYPFADWLLASELLVGGIKYEKGESTQETIRAWQELTDMSTLMKAAEEEVSPEDMAKRVVEAREKTWHTVWKAPILRQKLRQSIAGYHGPDFEPFRAALRETYLAMPTDQRNPWQAHIERNECDVFEAAHFMDQHVTASTTVGHAEERFLAFRKYYASTHDMINSDSDKVTNGLGFNWVGWKEQPCDLKSALGNVPAPPCGWNGGPWDACDEWKDAHPPASTG